MHYQSIYSSLCYRFAFSQSFFCVLFSLSLAHGKWLRDLAGKWERQGALASSGKRLMAVTLHLLGGLWGQSAGQALKLKRSQLDAAPVPARGTSQQQLATCNIGRPKSRGKKERKKSRWVIVRKKCANWAQEAAAERQAQCKGLCPADAARWRPFGPKVSCGVCLLYELRFACENFYLQLVHKCSHCNFFASATPLSP